MSYLFKTWLNFREEERTEEINTLPSETQPDEVLTVRQMLERHVRGLPISGNEQGVYLPEEIGYIPDYRTLDLTEIDEMREQWSETVQRYNNPEPAPAGGTPNTDEGGMAHATTDPPTPSPTPINSPQA